MNCQACGTDVPGESRFCPKCGNRIGEVGEARDEPQTSTVASPAERFRASAIERKDDDLDEEEMLWEGGYSGKAMIGSWMLATLATVALLVLVFVFLPAWFFFLALIVILWCSLGLTLAYRKLSVHYELSSQRFIHKLGILKRTTDRIEVIDIDDVTFEQGLIQRLVGVGTIKINSSDRTHPELLLRGIDDVKRIADLVDDVRRTERRRRGLHIEAI